MPLQFVHSNLVAMACKTSTMLQPNYCPKRCLGTGQHVRTPFKLSKNMSKTAQEIINHKISQDIIRSQKISKDISPAQIHKFPRTGFPPSPAPTLDKSSIRRRRNSAPGGRTSLALTRKNKGVQHGSTILM